MHSTLTLSTQVRNGQTRLQQSFASPPLKLLSLPPDAEGMLRAVQMSSSPGLLSGDLIETDITLAPHSKLSLYTQAFTRVLQMHEGNRAEQRTRIRQEPHSSLCYLPHPLVLHAGSTLVQSTEIDLAEGCELIYGEIVAAGRILRGEAFAFTRFSSHLCITRNGRKLISDNIQWQPGRHRPDTLGQMEHYTHQLNLFYVHTGRDSAEIRALSDRMSEYLEGHPAAASALWGVSQAAGCALCLRALANDAQSLQNLMKTAVGRLHLPQSSPLSAAFFR